MITVGMNYHIIDGKQSLFEEKFNAVLGALEDASPGHDKSFLYVDVNDKQSYCIISQWNDQAAFGAFMRSDECFPRRCRLG